MGTSVRRDPVDGRTIDLAVVVVPALSERPAAEPWFDFEGGPGDLAVSLARAYTEELATFRRDRDVVLVDQRGVGDSVPSSARSSTNLLTR